MARRRPPGPRRVSVRASAAPRFSTRRPESGQPNFAYGYVAEVVDLTIDIETGHIKVDRVICADDVGRVINRI